MTVRDLEAILGEPTYRRTGSSEAGVTLAELLMALLVLGLVMAGLVSVTVATLGVTQVNDARSAATNLAQAEIERLRALPFADLDIGGRQVRSVEEGGRSYEVVVDTTWVGLSSDADICAEPDRDPDTSVVRVDVHVSRDDVDGHEVSSSTTIAPPPVTPSVDRGALTVLVTDHQDPPEPVPFVWVTVTGPTEHSGQVRTQVTPATGCVLFADLPEGTYQVRLDRSAHVSIGGEPQPARTTSVTASTRTSVDVSYAPAGTLQLDAVPRGGADALLPTSTPVSMSRREIVTRSVSGAVIGPVWPGLWEVWAGDCPDADPLGIDDEENPFWPGAVRQDRIRVPAGGSVTAAADLAVVRVVITGELSTPSDPQPVTITARPAGSDCSAGTAELLFPSTLPIAEGSVGRIDIALPYGTWELVATNAVISRRADGVVVDPRGPGLAVVTPS